MIGAVSNFAVRRAEPADAEQIADVFLAARAEMTYLPHRHTGEETRSWIATVVLPTRRVWVVAAHQGIAGFAALVGDHLDHLYVRPDSQGRGIGSALLAEAKAASPDGLSLFVFARNVRARAFYERHGFAPVAFGDGSGNEEREPDVRYEWSPHDGADAPARSFVPTLVERDARATLSRDAQHGLGEGT